MGLVEQRDSWIVQFKEGLEPLNPKLDMYRENRNKESWRSSLLDEKNCEYIMWLESEVHTLEQKVIELTEVENKYEV